MHCFVYKRYCPVLYFPCKIRYTEDHIGRIFIFCRLWQFQYGGTVYVSYMGKNMERQSHASGHRCL